MKKTLALILFAATLILALTGCMQILGYSEIKYEFYQDTDTIESIELIKMTNSDYDFDDNGKEIITVYEFEILTQVTDTKQFLSDFESLMCFTMKKIVDLYPESDEYAVKINYTNETAEIIGAYGQVFIVNDTYIISDKAQHFLEDEFNGLVEMYLASNNYFEI
ncbi:MAG: hypothetical protein E7617_05070 [Ruminococcaceae bacterium]|nr:hypothetical protein [Oscillospiraceae bacterium]